MYTMNSQSWTQLSVIKAIIFHASPFCPGAAGLWLARQTHPSGRWAGLKTHVFLITATSKHTINTSTSTVDTSPTCSLSSSSPSLVCCPPLSVVECSCSCLSFPLFLFAQTLWHSVLSYQRHLKLRMNKVWAHRKSTGSVHRLSIEEKGVEKGGRRRGALWWSAHWIWLLCSCHQSLLTDGCIKYDRC